MVKASTTNSTIISGMTDAPKEFIDWVEQQRDRRGWGIREAARSIGVSHPTISEIVTYGKQPSFETCLALAQAFDVSPVWVMQLAGLLPKEPDRDERIENVAHLMQQMDDVDKDDVLDYARLVLGRRKQRSLLEEFKARLDSIPPDQTSEITRELYAYLVAAGARRVK